MPRPQPSQVERVACVGAGTIGAGWAAYFLSRGLEVTATDPDPDGERKLRRFVDRAWPQLEILGLAAGADRSKLSFVAGVEEAVADAQFVQESAPDRLELKQDLFEVMGAASRPDTVLSSSSSEFIPSDLAVRCAHPQRCIVGHPFAPSYLMPLVEVVGGRDTTGEVMDWSIAFYTHIGKVALRLKKEIESYIANRLQFAVFEEMHNLVDQGICDYDDVDTAMRYGPGLRWAFAGPLLCLHMGGGQGGLGGFIDHFGWSGPEHLESKARSEVETLYGAHSMDDIEAWRDGNLQLMLKGLKPAP
jgi:3-hydroxyacyl-CoA dehydrogenase